MATTSHLLRRLQLILPLRIDHHRFSTSAPLFFRWPWQKTSTAEQPTTHEESVSSTATTTADNASTSAPASSVNISETEGSNGLKDWEEIQEEIRSDIEPIVSLVRVILHSSKYATGDYLSTEDEELVKEKLLRYHPKAEEKIGSGVDSIIVDFHPQFQGSRCMFVVKTDGEGVDFSYRKCLRSYLMQKYPVHAERFIRIHKYLGRD